MDFIRLLVPNDGALLLDLMAIIGDAEATLPTDGVSACEVGGEEEEHASSLNFGLGMLKNGFAIALFQSETTNCVIGNAC